eukprot:CAMPEP_0177778210 /NCGR_PEP_ID=MMETSP0491_2-20121128/15825_1 /TAXON_ID=63592 /ORGANISM="Tetraselmis chuii, Strain PLY429" /LENGTH=45 /DNA_ID= /DNA_START= /DNA_END= /DNA_ORIENTATION=
MMLDLVVAKVQTTPATRDVRRCDTVSALQAATQTLSPWTYQEDMH